MPFMDNFLDCFRFLY